MLAANLNVRANMQHARQQYFQATAYRNTLTDLIPSFATFWNVKKTA